MQCVSDDPRDWRALAYAFGTLLVGEDQPARNDQLVSLVVHELRTPVAIIKAYAQLLDAQLAQARRHARRSPSSSSAGGSPKGSRK